MLSLGWAKWPTALPIDRRIGVTLASRGNSTSSKIRGLEVLSLQDSLRCSTHEGSTKNKGEVIAKPNTLQAITYGHTYKNQNFFFFGSPVTWFRKRPVSIIKTPTWIFMWMSTCKSGTRNELPIVFLEESRMSTSSVSPSRLRPDMSSGTEASRTLKNKLTARRGTWVISPDSHASHPLHFHALGY